MRCQRVHCELDPGWHALHIDTIVINQDGTRQRKEHSHDSDVGADGSVNLMREAFGFWMHFSRLHVYGRCTCDLLAGDYI